MAHLGDFDASAVLYGKFTTYRPSTGATFTLGGTPALSVYKDNSTTQSTTGVTLTADFDSVTGLNHFAIDTSADGTFYSAGSFFDVVITTGTVDSVSVTGSVVASFTIRKNSALKPTTAGRTLVVDAAGLADANTVKVGPTGSGTAQTAGDIIGDTNDIQTRLPAALVSGRMDSSTGAMAADVLTASALAADAGVELAAAVWDRVISAANHNVGGSAGKRLRELTNSVVTSGTAQAGGTASITLAAAASSVDGTYDPAMVRISAGTGVGQARLITQYVGSTRVASVDRDWRVAPDNTSEYEIIAAPNLISTNEGLAQAGGATTITLNASASSVDDTYVGQTVVLRTGTGQDQSRIISAYNGTTKVATVSVAWQTNPASGTGYLIWPLGRARVTAMEAGVITASAIASDAITDAKVASDVTIASVTGAVGSVTGAVGSVTGNVGGNVTGSVGSVATGGISAASFAAGAIDAAAIAANAIGASELAADAVAEIADAVWDEVLSGHLTAGTTGAALNGATAPSAAAVADAVWDELLSGHVISGSTGEALTASGGAGDPWITALPGSYSAGQAGKIVGDYLNATVSSRATQTSVDTIDDFLDTEVAAIKAKTDLIPAAPAAVGDIPTAAAVADAVWDEATSGHVSAGSTGLALRDADLRGSRTVVRGTVGAATTPSTTQFTPSAFSPAGASADQFKGRIIVFDNDTATAALRGEATDITASSNAATPLLTFTALSATPASGDTFSVL